MKNVIEEYNFGNRLSQDGRLIRQKQEVRNIAQKFADSIKPVEFIEHEVSLIDGSYKGSMVVKRTDLRDLGEIKNRFITNVRQYEDIGKLVLYIN